MKLFSRKQRPAPSHPLDDDQPGIIRFNKELTQAEVDEFKARFTAAAGRAYLPSQCSATTGKGTQCKNPPAQGSDRCVLPAHQR